MAKIDVKTIIILYKSISQNRWWEIREQGVPILSAIMIKIGFMMFFERGEWDLPAAFYLIRKIWTQAKLLLVKGKRLCVILFYVQFSFASISKSNFFHPMPFCAACYDLQYNLWISTVLKSTPGKINVDETVFTRHQYDKWESEWQKLLKCWRF